MNTPPKPVTPKDPNQSRLQEEALRVAKSIQTPGQTKEQTKLIAKGIEKGIALYKQQHNAKARELDKAKKKAAKLKAQAVQSSELSADDEISAEWTYSASPLPLHVAGSIFSLVGLLHVIRILLGWKVEIGGWGFPMLASWALAALAFGLSFWMFKAARE